MMGNTKLRPLILMTLLVMVVMAQAQGQRAKHCPSKATPERRHSSICKGVRSWTSRIWRDSQTDRSALSGTESF
jgi:hypothetical protein